MMCDKDLFKEDFKYYKKKNPLPNLDQVIDFDLHSKYDIVLNVKEKYLNLIPNENQCSVCGELGLRYHQTWETYSIKGLDGFIYIKNPFTVAGQQIWIRKCLEKYPRKPSVTNLDLHYTNIDDIWSLRNHPDFDKREYLSKLCWTTFGYHHNWDTKVYNPNHKADFPDCLQELSKHFAHCLGFTTYIPEAAIVNYYNLKSSLGIHNDHSEQDVDSPIISISLGQTGVFLIGTENKFAKPKAMLLRSGDVIVMSGACRLSYHAVPCIISENVSARYFDSQTTDWVQFYEYINKSRINISIRQVYQNVS